jgi:hypothetical protein
MNGLQNMEHRFLPLLNNVKSKTGRARWTKFVISKNVGEVTRGVAPVK